MKPGAVHFALDSAWDDLAAPARAGLETIDALAIGREVRFIAPARTIEAFVQAQGASFRPFTLTGSGDFHHLTALWLRQFTEPLLLLSFDNHPDWDVRPPDWSCGAWINRALENDRVREISIWGCASFECRWPGRLLGARAAARAGRLRVHPWETPEVSYPDWLHPTTPETWRDTFLTWTQHHAGEAVYMTLDLDCLAPGEAVTNWEQGRFRREDIVWALGEVHRHLRVIGGDLCGAWSPPIYARPGQRFAAWFDHPPQPKIDPTAGRSTNEEAFRQLWPALLGS